MNLEDDLRAALERVEAPSGFATRVVARAWLQQVPRGDQANHLPQRRTTRSRVVVLAAAASLALATSSGLVYLDHQKQADAERARGLAVLALRVASAELQQIQARVVNRHSPSLGGEKYPQNPSEQHP